MKTFIFLILLFQFSCSVRNVSEDIGGQRSPSQVAHTDPRNPQHLQERIKEANELADSPIEKFRTLSDAELAYYALSYQYMFIKKSGQYVIDPNTNLIKTQSRVFRSYMRQKCHRLEDSELAVWNVQDWAGFPLDLCEYNVQDDAGKRLVKRTNVILLSISEQLFANWITDTCIEIGQKNFNCVKLITDRVILQSNGQFIVRGISYEDQYKYNLTKVDDGEDGYFEPYCFRDGITVYTGSFDSKNIFASLTEKQVKSCFGNDFINEDRKVGRNARIVGTTATAYEKYGDKKVAVMAADGKVALIDWLKVSREEMQKAFRTKKNNMMLIWAKANLSLFRK